jgi:hypothetical protein
LTVDPDRAAALLAPLKRLEGKGLKTGVYHLPDYRGLEIRFGGFHPDGTVKQIQSAVPPTAGTDGRPRQWNGGSAIAPAPESLYAALARSAPAPVNDQSAVARAEKAHPESDNRPALWFRKALENEAGKVAMA